jgi:hypothetical protein
MSPGYSPSWGRAQAVIYGYETGLVTPGGHAGGGNVGGLA